MDPLSIKIILGLAVIFGLYMSWNIGANDVANAMGTSVGSHALTINQAIFVAAIFEFGGAFLVGGDVTNTIRKGIFDASLFAGRPFELMVGMLASLLAAAVWLQLASWKGLPVSTTHSIVGAVVGFTIVSTGFGAIEWGKMAAIVASWFISPLCGATIAFFVFFAIRRTILDSDEPVASTRKVAPILVFILGTVLGLILFFKGLKNLHLDITWQVTVGIALAFGFAGSLIVVVVLRNFRAEESDSHLRQNLKVEKVFSWLQIVTACFMAFAHGSNDVANAVGPLAGIVATLNEGAVAAKSELPKWVLALGGVGIVIGLATWGRKVIETVGKNITEMTPTRGFAAEFGACITILIGSRLGLPLSTTHVLVGAVIGVGLARGMAALNLRVIRNIAASWFITVPVGGLLSAVFYLILVNILPR
ncbi:MAG: inorganic phosphate transporter [Deltaproteobacteria bacterium]|nr:inorganic phosphate transporter [Deltaproteobacteria bacterium]